MKLDIKGEGIKPFKLEVKEFNLNERIELNNLLYKFFNNKEGMFGPAIDIVRMATDLDDNQIKEHMNQGKKPHWRFKLENKQVVDDPN